MSTMLMSAGSVVPVALDHMDWSLTGISSWMRAFQMQTVAMKNSTPEAGGENEGYFKYNLNVFWLCHVTDSRGEADSHVFC